MAVYVRKLVCDAWLAVASKPSLVTWREHVTMEESAGNTSDMASLILVGVADAHAVPLWQRSDEC